MTFDDFYTLMLGDFSEARNNYLRNGGDCEMVWWMIHRPDKTDVSHTDYEALGLSMLLYGVFDQTGFDDYMSRWA